MCLQYVNKTITVKKGTGFKGVGKDDWGHAIPPIFGDTRYKIDTWMRDPLTRTLLSEKDDKLYETGYHIYLDNTPNGRHFYGEELRPVEFDEVVAQGTQDRHRVVVAKKMFMPRKRRGKNGN